MAPRFSAVSLLASAVWAQPGEQTQMIGVMRAVVQKLATGVQASSAALLLHATFLMPSGTDACHSTVSGGIQGVNPDMQMKGNPNQLSDSEQLAKDVAAAGFKNVELRSASKCSSTFTTSGWLTAFNCYQFHSINAQYRQR
jgi:hypothetical protein